MRARAALSLTRNDEYPISSPASVTARYGSTDCSTLGSAKFLNGISTLPSAANLPT